MVFGVRKNVRSRLEKKIKEDYINSQYIFFRIKSELYIYINQKKKKKKR